MRNFIYISLFTVVAVVAIVFTVGQAGVLGDGPFGLWGKLGYYSNEKLNLNHPSSEDGSEVKSSQTKPSPLVGKNGNENSFLTKDGIFYWTNEKRVSSSSFPAFYSSSLLDQVAQSRLEDMFDQQYFDHVSPQGVEVSQVALSLGYEYIAVGENIALGNFKDDKALVEAWMDSPGHRENILSGNYTEMGIAAGKSMYEGRPTWIGVQIFGRPLSDCPEPDASLSNQIDENKEDISDLEIEADILYAEIELGLMSNEEYREKVEQYNGIVDEINSLVSETKALIEDFNSQVSAFNFCIDN